MALMGDKNTPLAKGVRTFGASMVGVLAAAVVADWVVNFKASATAFALGTIAAALAGLVAAGGAFKDITGKTTGEKALFTAIQFFAAGIATFGVADLTGAAAVDFGRNVLRVAIAAVFAGAYTLVQNGAESTPVAP